jgi:hypothetical protein
MKRKKQHNCNLMTGAVGPNTSSSNLQATGAGPVMSEDWVTAGWRGREESEQGWRRARMPARAVLIRQLGRLFTQGSDSIS